MPNTWVGSGAGSPRAISRRHRHRNWWLALLVATLFLVRPESTQAQEGSDAIDRLWIDMSIRPQLVAEYNVIARPHDIARADHVSMVDVLDEVTQGRKLLVFKSVADAEMLVPRLQDKFDIIGYNLENGPANRPDEQADPVGSIRRMRQLADRYDKELALGPDRHFAINDGVAMAPYVDIFILQVQRVQEDPATVREFLEPLARQYRAVNPDIQISAQIRTEGDTAELRALTASLTDLLDGISILTSPETVAVADALLAELRPNGAALAQTDAVNVAAETPAPDDGQQAAIAPTAPPQVIPTQPGIAQEPAVVAPRVTLQTTPVVAAELNGASESAFDQRWFMVGSLLTIGILGGGLLIASLVYAYQNLGGR